MQQNVAHQTCQNFKVEQAKRSFLLQSSDFGKFLYALPRLVLEILLKEHDLKSCILNEYQQNFFFLFTLSLYVSDLLCYHNVTFLARKLDLVYLPQGNPDWNLNSLIVIQADLVAWVTGYFSVVRGQLIEILRKNFKLTAWIWLICFFIIQNTNDINLSFDSPHLSMTCNT